MGNCHACNRFMKAGQTLRAKDGYQVLLFPLPELYITQTSSSSSFSHCCGHPIDCVMQGQSKATLYAPCDCHLIYEGATGNGHPLIFQSDKPVHTPSGLKTVVFNFTHGDLLGNGKTYKQGKPIATTGTYGFVTGDHVHIDQSFTAGATLVNSGITCSGGNVCWNLKGSVSPTAFWYVNDTKIVSTQGLTFKTFSGGSTGEILNWIIPVMETNPDATSRYLTNDEMKNNAKCFYGTMKILYGWTLNACCGALGNIESESGINPNMWEGLDKNYHPVQTEGYGLVQWTPYTNITNWIASKGKTGQYQEYGDLQCEKLSEEVKDGSQWIPVASYPMSFEEFTKSTQSPEYLADVFLRNYERPANINQPIRRTQAKAWYDFLKNWKPVLPNTNDPNGIIKSKKFNFFLYYFDTYRL